MMSQPEKQETNIASQSLLLAFSTKIEDLKNEIVSYKVESNIWKIAEGITNSGGNLCLHLVGNLNHFIGAQLGKTGYERKRDNEFSETGLSRDELVAMIDDLAIVVKSTLEGINDTELAEDYPEVLFEKQMNKLTVLAYMSGHLSYHLGQLNYHRRLLDR